MMEPSRRRALRDERGLVGKILLLWLVLLVVLVVGAIDAGSILLARSRAADLAEDASVSAAAAFAQSVLDNFPLVAGLVGALLVGKGIAAAVVGRAFGYSPAARLTMWALTLPQLAATLAAAIVAHHTVDAAGHRMLDGNMLNAVLVLMLTTSILGPLLTERFAPRLTQEERA